MDETVNNVVVILKPMSILCLENVGFEFLMDK